MSALALPGPLVDVHWLAERLDHPDLVVLDAGVGAHRGEPLPIRGARVFDLDGALSDHADPRPHTMPDAAQFTAEVRALGINDRSTVVVYDGAGVYSSARAWWMFRAMGFDSVAVLDGGLPAWTAAGLPRAAAGPAPAAPGNFTATSRPGLIVDSATVLAALADESSAVLDARTRERFAGTAPEPRAGLRGGHMPGAFSLPFGELQTAGHMLPPTELQARLVELVGDRERLLFSCGSGVTACILTLGAELAGYHDLAVYDGSWSEWGMPSDLPVATGA
ncbi:MULTISPECIES: sulfurtransferase [unclassified Kitasatospora]|uniref:sulfurtransferase n=1 Tax=unclassified Kitasatospora TaxID=2633591 RepID=UPI00070B0688|nr:MULTISPECIES: sulfurtransferase [unclassified Kitasatospora]KQV19232.1 3-mercaptopyruvate sulfurtransferase [Kitasatospora sp. Root107]KRB77508.1 3-mercaptopyruvate sulfurtransferase [Kitasatospora sp. Root187]